MSRQSLLLRAVLFCILSAGLFGGLAAAPLLLKQFSRILPDNYSRRAVEALDRKEWRTAEKICRDRIDKVWWDMDAHYLLARALEGAGKPADAAGLMLEAMRKVETARGRNLTITGYDEAATLHRLAGYLWQAGQYVYAGEMYRVAVDAGSPEVGRDIAAYASSLPPDPEGAAAVAAVALKLRAKAPFDRAVGALESSGQNLVQARALVLRARWHEEVAKDPAAALQLLHEARASGGEGAKLQDEPLVRLALASCLRRNGFGDEALEQEAILRSFHGIRVVNLEQFRELPVGATSTSSTLQLTRRGSASARLETGAFRTTNLLVRAIGAPALGHWPILAVSAGDRELLRLYLDGIQPSTFDLPLFPEGAPKVLQLSLGFLNDAYDPVTRADRDVKVQFLAFY